MSAIAGVLGKGGTHNKLGPLVRDGQWRRPSYRAEDGDDSPEKEFAHVPEKHRGAPHGRDWVPSHRDAARSRDQALV